MPIDSKATMESVRECLRAADAYQSGNAEGHDPTKALIGFALRDIATEIAPMLPALQAARDSIRSLKPG